jgi:hypothetical protein
MIPPIRGPAGPRKSPAPLAGGNRANIIKQHDDRISYKHGVRRAQAPTLNAPRRAARDQVPPWLAS